MHDARKDLRANPCAHVLFQSAARAKQYQVRLTFSCTIQTTGSVPVHYTSRIYGRQTSTGTIHRPNHRRHNTSWYGPT